MPKEVNWDLLGFAKASKYRKSIILNLKSNQKTPKELAEELEFYISHVSTTLHELVDKGIIICLTPGRRKGKLFALSEIGHSIALKL